MSRLDLGAVLLVDKHDTYVLAASLAFAPGCHSGTGPVKSAAIHVRRASGF